MKGRVWWAIASIFLELGAFRSLSRGAPGRAALPSWRRGTIARDYNEGAPARTRPTGGGVPAELAGTDPEKPRSGVAPPELNRMWKEAGHSSPETRHEAEN